MIQVLGRYMIIRYLDPWGECVLAGSGAQRLGVSTRFRFQGLGFYGAGLRV